MAGVQVDGRAVAVRRTPRRANCSTPTIGIVGAPYRRRHRPRAAPPAAGIRCATGRAILHALPIGYSLDGVNGVRDPRGMVGGALRRRHACRHRRYRRGAQSHARGRALPSRGRGDGRDALCAGLAVLVDDEAELGAAVVDIGAGTTTHGRVPRRPAGPCRRFRGRRQSRDDGYRARTQHPVSRRRTAQDALWQCLARAPTSARRSRCRRSARRARAAPQFISRASWCASSGRASRRSSSWCATGSAASPFAAEPRGHVVLTGGASQLTGLPDGGAHPRPAGAHRPAARHCRAAGGGQRPGFRRGGRPADLSASRRMSSISSRGARGNCMTGRAATSPASADGSREFLMVHRSRSRNDQAVGGGPASGSAASLAPALSKRQR